MAAWGFMHSFGDTLGLWPASLAETLAALCAGSAARLTTELHVALLRLLQVRGPPLHSFTCPFQLPPFLADCRSRSLVGASSKVRGAWRLEGQRGVEIADGLCCVRSSAMPAWAWKSPESRAVSKQCAVLALRAYVAHHSPSHHVGVVAITCGNKSDNDGNVLRSMPPVS